MKRGTKDHPLADADKSAQLQMVRLLTRHQVMIQAYAYSIVRDFHFAEDVYQEVAMVVVNQWETMPKGEAVAAWLRELTRRKALEAYRQLRHAHPSLPEERLTQLGAYFGETPAGGQEGRDLRDIMAECLDKLQGVARAVVQARYAGGLACEQIARQIHRSVQSVYAILKRARGALSQCVEQARKKDAREGVS